jgi:CzcA family heavy metal efflux pump
MWIVKLALDRPYTFVVMAIVIAIFGVLSVKQMPVDIFPHINVPVLTCVWTFDGLNPREMERRIISPCERASQVTVSGIEHVESLSLLGKGLVKIYLHQDANVQESLAELTAVCQAILKQMPPGETPPFTTAISATDIPVMQLCLSSRSLSEAALFDFANNFLRSQVNTVAGASMPWPYGGAPRQVMVDIDPAKLAAKGVSAADVSLALNNQNIILPAGTAKMGDREYYVQLNSSPNRIAMMNEMPVKQVGDATVLIKDVANVHDGTAVQTNICNEDGTRAILFNIIKLGAASTIDVVNGIKATLPAVRHIMPAGTNLRVLNDQSIFVKESVDEVAREGLTAAGLTALLMLLLLGDWKSTVIVATSIPLSVLAGLILLNVGHQTINVMTLGGFALAVGMLVDDATVEVENIHRHLDLVRQQRIASRAAGAADDHAQTGQWVYQGILDAAMEIAVPAFVSTVAICIVFTPVLLLTEPAKSLFTPLALAVTGSMMCSYLLSRTVVPVMARYMLGGHADPEHGQQKRVGFGAVFAQITKRVDHGFEAMRNSYQGILTQLLRRKVLVTLGVLGFIVISFSLIGFLGADFFPAIDGTVVRMHVSAPRGMRVEETELLVKKVEKTLRQLIPPQDLDSIADVIGIPNSGINLSSSDSVNYTAADGEILITLKESHAQSCSYYRNLLRDKLPALYPQCGFFFQPADIVTQILNAGLAAPIDVQVRCFDIDNTFDLAQKLKRQIAKVPGAVDVHIKQSMSAPVINVNVDRQKAAQLGFTQSDIASAMLVSLSGSFQTAPNFWVDPHLGVSYSIAVQTPQRMMTDLTDIANTVVTSKDGTKTQLLGNLASFEHSLSPTIVNHYNTLAVIDVLASVDGSDLYSVGKKVQAIVDSYKNNLPHGVFVEVRGQMSNMISAYGGLLTGVLFALVLVYLLLVVNFQSWLDPVIILMAIPGAMCGIIWALFLTQTNFSVPALMGAIMSIGVASANSILVVSFARERLAEGMNARQAAISAGFTRFRPVIMTAAAMIIGMIPMAIGSGSGGAQNAPLGRAVIGGLVVATFFTLVWVPLVFSVVHRNANRKPMEGVSSASVAHH